MPLINDVARFHQEVLQMPPQPCSMLDEVDIKDRVNFMCEELDEFEVSAHANDIVGAADALADLVYVAIGTAYMMGLPFQAIWDAVQKANMGKVRGGTKRNMRIDAMKPAGWVAPEVEIEKLIQDASAKSP